MPEQALTDAPEYDRRTLSRWRIAVTAAFLLGGTAIASWGPRLPALRTDLDVDTGGLGLLLAGVTVGSVAGLGAATPLLGRLGARRAVPTAVVAMAAAVALVGIGASVLHSVPVVAVAFVLAGLAIGSLDVMINVEGSAVEQAMGRTVMPLMHAAWSAGVAVGSGIGAGCAALGWSPAVQFSGLAVLLVLAAGAVGRWIPSRETSPSMAKQPVPQRVREWARGWTDPRLLLIGLVMLGVNLGEGSANSWLTLSAQDGHGLSPATAALFFTVFAATEMTARIVGGPLVDRIGRVATIRLTTALGVAGVAAFVLVDHPAGVLAGVVLWAVGVSMGFPLGMSAAAASGPNPAARVAVVASLGYFSNLAGPPAVGFVAQVTGLLPALWVIAALLTVAFLVAPALGQSSKR